MTRSVLFPIGVCVLILGTGPLLAIIFFEGPDANPVLPGMIAMVTFPLAISLMLKGRQRDQRKQ